MKRSRTCWTVLLTCLLLLAGCGSGAPAPDPAPTAGWKDVPFTGDQWYAVAYLGYQGTGDLAQYAERYLEDPRLPTHYISAGDFYLVIPRYAGMSLSLSVNDPETQTGRLCFQDPACGPFLLQCNASDIFADVTVRLTYEGESVEFSPFVSLADGSLDIGGAGQGLDITESNAGG